MLIDIALIAVGLVAGVIIGVAVLDRIILSASRR